MTSHALQTEVNEVFGPSPKNLNQLQLISQYRLAQAMKNTTVSKTELSARDLNGRTSFIVSAKENFLPIFQQLMLSGAELQDLDNSSHSALFYASENGNMEMVQALLKAGLHPSEEVLTPMQKQRWLEQHVLVTPGFYPHF
jgi:ankyrin repeat protein